MSFALEARTRSTAVIVAESEKNMKNMNKVIKHLEKRVERLKKLAEKDMYYLEQLEKEERDLDYYYYKVYG